MRNNRKAILQFGRHIYHLDNFEPSIEKKLRSKLDSISYDYADINDWIRSKSSDRNGLEKDLVILSENPIHVCKGDDCEEDDRKIFRKYDDHVDWKHGKNQLRFVKRFKIIDNRNKAKKSKYDSSEEYPKKKRSSKKKKKKQKYSSESVDSNSEEHSNRKESRKKKIYTSEDSREVKKKHKKKYDDFSASEESFKDESTSIEETKKKKKKKKNYESLEDTNRKTIGATDDYFMQGNKIFHSNGGKKKRHDFDERRRLPHFLPKRYHWDPEDIHDLGYYWFNGPRGAYPAPQNL